MSTWVAPIPAITHAGRLVRPVPSCSFNTAGMGSGEWWRGDHGASGLWRCAPPGSTCVYKHVYTRETRLLNTCALCPLLLGTSTSILKRKEGKGVFQIQPCAPFSWMWKHVFLAHNSLAWHLAGSPWAGEERWTEVILGNAPVARPSHLKSLHRFLPHIDLWRKFSVWHFKWKTCH